MKFGNFASGQEMVEHLANEYRSGHHGEVVALYEAGNAVFSKRLPATLLMVAQSYIKLGRPLDAAPLLLEAGRAMRPRLKAPVELAFTLYSNGGEIAAALDAAGELLRIDARHHAARRYRRRFLQYTLSFDEIAAENRQALIALRQGDDHAIRSELPWDNVCWCPDEAINARIFSDAVTPFTAESTALRRGLPITAPGERIRIAYLSNDFSTFHATMVLFRAVLEAHDAERFELRLFCYTSEPLARIDQGFRASRQDIVSINDFDDEAAARLIRGWQPDILVDLKGHTQDARSNLVNMGLAPIQVAYLGFPGSVTGVDCDYVIGDAIVTPDASKPYYHEKICRLPGSYQPNDNIYRPDPLPARRAELGLPEDHFVFASFNAVRKISPDAFSAWMRIMRRVPNSVLWLMCDDELAKARLLAYAARAGIVADRFVFARKTGQTTHIARLKAADLALDTWPCNGHTTSSDALWAGLPLITVKGSNFASRVSESLLTSLDMKELVADNASEYVDLAVDLATDRARLSRIRAGLAETRRTSPLFDSKRYARNLERAYELMVERARNGLAPEHFDVREE